MAEDHEHEPLPPGLPPVTRRGFLFTLGLGLNAIAAAFIGVPILGYVFSSCLLYTSPSPRDATLSRMPSSA